MLFNNTPGLYRLIQSNSFVLYFLLIRQHHLLLLWRYRLGINLNVFMAWIKSTYFDNLRMQSKPRNLYEIDIMSWSFYKFQYWTLYWIPIHPCWFWQCLPLSFAFILDWRFLEILRWSLSLLCRWRIYHILLFLNWNLNDEMRYFLFDLVGGLSMLLHH